MAPPYEEQGFEGLRDRSRRLHASPNGDGGTFRPWKCSISPVSGFGRGISGGKDANRERWVAARGSRSSLASTRPRAEDRDPNRRQSD